MKKIIKTLLAIATPVIATPMVLSLSSCVNAFGGQIRLYENTLNYNDKTRYGQLPTGLVSLKQVVYGSKNFYTGNYVLAFGSSQFKTTIKFLFGDNDTIGGNIDIYNNPSLNYSDYVKGISNYEIDNPTEVNKKEIGFASYIETQPKENIDEDIISPFEKWTKDDENKDEKHKEGEYKRKDTSAEDFRGFIENLKILFGEDNFSEDALKDSCWLIYWKDGIPQKIDRNINQATFEKSLQEVYKDKKDSE